MKTAKYVILLGILFLVGSGCASGIKIVKTQRPELNAAQQTEIFAKLVDGCDFKTLEFETPEEKQQFFFCLQLFYAEEYYRAITEFMRFQSFFVESSKINLANFFIGECYRAAKNYLQAVDFYGKVISAMGYPFEQEIEEETPQTQRNPMLPIKQDFSLGVLCDFNIGLCYFYAKNYVKTVLQCQKLQRESKSELMQSFAHYLHFVTAVAKEDFDQAAKLLDDFYSKFPEHLTGITLKPQELMEFGDVSSRSEFLAGAFSTIVPGLGQIYTGRPIEALVSLVLTGIFGFAAYEGFVEQQEILGSISAFFAVSFYLANIYNAVNSAQSYNRNRELEFYYEMLGKIDSPLLHLFLIPAEQDGNLFLTFTFRR